VHNEKANPLTASIYTSIGAELDFIFTSIDPSVFNGTRP
jgi:hypothetical protein